MKVITDVNVILSALIRDSTTRKIILNSEFDFYFPEPSLHKIRKYKNYILEKSGLTEAEYDKLMATLFKYVKLVPTEEIEKNWDEAKKIMEHIDPEDVVFIATALSIDDSVIWSDDRHFEKQDKARVLKTEDMI
ncbi:PIN domain-containing protein [Candidatus Woesearchaeota archaeon]|nr:PIN domain-containing protein [Candidatus Woesearchaeota archaeon]